jgi:acetyltransferase-like isoleucine patch superfamily enzyme
MFHFACQALKSYRERVHDCGLSSSTAVTVQSKNKGLLPLKENELMCSFFSPLLIWLSGVPKMRRVGFWLALKLEHGAFYSATARSIMALRYGVTIGAYSYGGCFVPGTFPTLCRIVRYVSLAQGICVHRRNHSLDRLSMHPFFFNRKLGFVPKDHADFSELSIEHDAWVGERSIITAGCQRIGIGAVVGAGAVVAKDVPDFAVVVGVPARIIKYRFSETIRERILASQWWDKPVSEATQCMAEMVKPLNEESLSTHPWLRAAQSSCGVPTVQNS